MIVDDDNRHTAISRVEKFVAKWRHACTKYARTAVLTCPVCESRLLISQNTEGAVTVNCTTEECLSWKS